MIYGDFRSRLLGRRIRLVIGVVLETRVPFTRGPIRVPYYLGDLKKGPELRRISTSLEGFGA